MLLRSKRPLYEPFKVLMTFVKVKLDNWTSPNLSLLDFVLGHSAQYYLDYFYMLVILLLLKKSCLSESDKVNVRA